MDLTEGWCVPGSIQVRAALVCTLEAALLSTLKSRQEVGEDSKGESARVASPEQAVPRTQDVALWKLRKQWTRDYKDCHWFRPDSFLEDSKGLVFSTVSPKLSISCPGNSSNMQTKQNVSNRHLGMF